MRTAKEKIDELHSNLMGENKDLNDTDKIIEILTLLSEEIENLKEHTHSIL